MRTWTRFESLVPSDRNVWSQQLALMPVHRISSTRPVPMTPSPPKRAVVLCPLRSRFGWHQSRGSCWWVLGSRMQWWVSCRTPNCESHEFYTYSSENDEIPKNEKHNNSWNTLFSKEQNKSTSYRRKKWKRSVTNKYGTRPWKKSERAREMSLSEVYSLIAAYSTSIFSNQFLTRTKSK